MSPAPVRKAAQAAPAYEEINFLAMSDYSGGFNIPEGDYAVYFEACMEPQHEKSRGTPRLGVLLRCFPLKGGEEINKFLSMGTKAHNSFAPNPNTGKGFVKLPDGAGGTLSDKSNWALLLNSLYQCGMPEGIASNDLTVIDGVWGHIQNIPEPEDRKGFGGSKTGEIEEEKRTPGMVPVFGEILDGGKPWEGTGGMPDETTAAVAAKPKPPVKAGPPARAAAKVAPPLKTAAPVVEEAGEADEEAVLQAAINAITAVLVQEKNKNGCQKLILRTGTFKAAKEAGDEAMAQAVIDTYFSSDEKLNSVLNELGYAVSGTSVKPQ